MLERLRDFLSFQREKGSRKKSLRSDERGIGFTTIIIAVGSLLGLGLLSQTAPMQNLDWSALVAIFALIVTGIGIAGWGMGALNADAVLLIASVAMGIFVIFEIGVVAAAGILVVGGTMYTINPWGSKRFWTWVVFIGVGLTFVFVGRYFGMQILLEESLQTMAEPFEVVMP